LKNTDYIEKWLTLKLSAKRYSHSLGTAECAKKLAKLYSLDEEKAYLAGLIHDCAKNLADDELLKIIKNDVKTGFDETELKNPKTYHAIAGSYIAKKEFEIEDSEIISAIRNHTIGRVDMTTFEKIIFLADKIEPNQRDEEYSKKIWDVIEKYDGVLGLDTALFKCFSVTIKSLVERKLYICPKTIDVYNSLQEKCAELSGE